MELKKTYNISNFVLNRPKTKIVCTLGPSTSSVTKIKQLIKSGMSVARLNLSHGNNSEHKKLINSEYIKQRGRYHMLLIHKQKKYPEGLNRIKQGLNIEQLNFIN